MGSGHVARTWSVYTSRSIIWLCLLAGASSAQAPLPFELAPGRHAVLPGRDPRAPVFHPEHILVRFRPGTPEVARAATRAAVGGRLKHRFRIVDDLELLAARAGSVERSIQALQRNPNVVYAEPDPIVHASQAPNDPSFDVLWGLQNIGQTVDGDPGTAGADANVWPVWTTWTGDPDFRIAVIDTGVNYAHPDLMDNIWTNPGEIAGNGVDDDGNGLVDDVHGYDFINEDPDPMDDHAHGSHVSGTIGAVGNNGVGVVGINWRCKIVGLKFLGAGGSGPLSGAIRSLEYCLANNIKVSNNSYGGGPHSQSMYLAIQNAQAVQHLFVAAAGNDASNNDLFPAYPASYDLPNVISVAATNNDDQLAPFSNFGAVSVDLGAPGVTVLSTVLGSNYSYFQGTSMASPHVAGVAGLIYSRFPGITFGEVRSRLLDSVRPVAALASKTLTGGVVNAFAAFGDCNGNGTLDSDEIASGQAQDCSGNEIPDDCEPDCNGNGSADSCDVFTGAEPDCNGDEIPDSCQPDCNGNGTPDVCEIVNGLLEDCDHDSVPDVCELADGAPDCNGNGTLDSCDVAAGLSEDCDENGVMDICEIESDCNSNGKHDFCDVIFGGSRDCDFNYVPDECQTTPDCNGNGQADHLDLCWRTSFDCNRNDFPDECDLGTPDWEDCDGNGILDHCEFGVLVQIVYPTNGSGPNIERHYGVSPPSPFIESLEEAGFLVDVSSVYHNLNPLGRFPDVILRQSLEVPAPYMADERVFTGELGMIFLDNWPAVEPCLGCGVQSFPASPVASRPDNENLLHDGGPAAAPKYRKRATTIDPASPLGRGLGTTSALEGFCMTPHLKAGVNTVVVWNDGTPLAATHAYGDGRVVYLNDISGWTGTGLWFGDPAFGKRLLRNAVLYVTPETKDCNLNQIMDSCEIRDGAAADVLPAGGDGIPDECQQDCNGNGVPDRTDITSGGSPDCDNNGVPDECTTLMRDCNGNGIPDACDILNGSSPDCWTESYPSYFSPANGIPDECDPDCDGNGIADLCDGADQLNTDCNRDFTLNVCEPDENANGTSDVCENVPSVLWSGLIGPSPHHRSVLEQLPASVTKVGNPDSPIWPADLSGFDLIVLTDQGVPESPERQAQVDQAVANGAGLVIFLPDRASRGDTVFMGESAPYVDHGPLNSVYRSAEAVVPSHATITRLPRLSSIVGISADAVLRPEAEVVMDWVDPMGGRRPMVVTMQYGAGRSIWLNIKSAEWWPEAYFDDRFYGAHLTKNVFEYALGLLVADCNENGVEDNDDIASFSSPDCDNNMFPDECQIDFSSLAPGGPFFCTSFCDPDCNATGVPDACELTDNDENTNGVPDECDPPPFIPATSTWGLVILALLVSAASSLFMRRKRCMTSCP